MSQKGEMRSVTDMSLVSGISAQHLQKIVDQEASPGEQHVRWIKKRLTKSESAALTGKLSKRAIERRALVDSIPYSSIVDNSDYGLIRSCPPENIKPQDYLALETNSGLQWVEVDDVVRDDKYQRIVVSVGDLTFYLYPNDYMRVLRRKS